MYEKDPYGFVFLMPLAILKLADDSIRAMSEIISGLGAATVENRVDSKLISKDTFLRHSNQIEPQYLI